MENINISVTYKERILEPTVWIDGKKLSQDPIHLPKNKAEIFGALGLRALERGLEMGLGRSTGWDLSSLKEAELSELQLAASVFKRGVATKPAASHTHVRHLEYPLEFFATVGDLMTHIDWTNKFVVIDETLLCLWNLKMTPATLSLRLNEDLKSVETVELIIDKWKQNGASKPFVIIGGGVLCDTAAFAADLVGAEFSFVPTTLLAMADVCVGGKTGVNFAPYGKNLVGRFAYPKAVYITVDWLETLPRRELKAGLTECLKHAILKGDEKLLEQLTLESMTSEILRHVIQVKAEIVAKDPLETGIRAVLNLGHTLGHALEGLSQKRQEPTLEINHGEAVALGLAYSFFLSHELGRISTSNLEKLLGHLQKVGVLKSMNELASFLNVAKDELAGDAMWRELYGFIAQDKKNREQTATTSWVLVQDGMNLADSPGPYTVQVEEAMLSKCWKFFVAWL
jgi:3-dehydroquinate synthetase